MPPRHKEKDDDDNQTDEDDVIETYNAAVNQTADSRRRIQAVHNDAVDEVSTRSVAISGKQETMTPSHIRLPSSSSVSSNVSCLTTAMTANSTATTAMAKKAAVAATGSASLKSAIVSLDRSTLKENEWRFSQIAAGIMETMHEMLAGMPDYVFDELVSVPLRLESFIM